VAGTVLDRRLCRRLAGLLFIGWLAAGCGSSTSSNSSTSSRVSTASSSAGAPADAQAAGAPGATRDAAPVAASAPLGDLARDERPRVVILGDSLTAGLGLGQNDAFPAVLQRQLDAAGLTYAIVNAGVSGDTSAGGLRRLAWVLEGDVRVLVVALGGNDGLRGVPAGELHRNLATIIDGARARGIAVVLAGMEAPPNFGRDYGVAFHRVYQDLSKRGDVAFVPFLLDHVAGIDRLNQPDGIHPTADGARIVAGNVWAVLEAVVRADAARQRVGRLQ
jgi:acyl-CoA thioesterase-1